MATIIFGGSFNPVHMGHWAMAKSALQVLPQASLVFMPAGCSPFKTNQTLAAEHHRYNMCKLMAEQDPRMVVSDLEFTMEKPSYTIDTIKRLQQEKEDEYYFLCGADSFLSLFSWKNIESLATKVTFLVANREGASSERLEEQKIKIQQLGGKVRFLPMEKFVVSSSIVREAITKNSLNSNFLDDKVLRYIQENNLYGE